MKQVYRQVDIHLTQIENRLTGFLKSNWASTKRFQVLTKGYIGTQKECRKIRGWTACSK